MFSVFEEEIISQINPLDGKEMGRKYHQFIRQDWENVKFKVIVGACK